MNVWGLVTLWLKGRPKPDQNSRTQFSFFFVSSHEKCGSALTPLQEVRGRKSSLVQDTLRPVDTCSHCCRWPSVLRKIGQNMETDDLRNVNTRDTHTHTEFSWWPTFHIRNAQLSFGLFLRTDVSAGCCDCVCVWERERNESAPRYAIQNHPGVLLPYLQLQEVACWCMCPNGSSWLSWSSAEFISLFSTFNSEEMTSFFRWGVILIMLKVQQDSTAAPVGLDLNCTKTLSTKSAA